MRAPNLTRNEWLLIEYALMGMPVSDRAKALGLEAENVRIKVTRLIRMTRDLESP